VSLSFGLGRYQPHAATEVLSNGYGDCKDKNTLLASLLQAEGFHSTSVLIGSQHKLDPDIPSPSQFDHVITRVSVDGRDIWLDSTNGVAPFQMLSAGLRSKQALAISPDGKATLVWTPAELPFESYDRTDVNGSISDTGKFTAHATMAARGDTELAMRFTLRQMPSNKWKDLFEFMVRRSGMNGAEISNLKISDPSNPDSPLQIDFDVTSSNYFDWSAPESKVPIPLTLIVLPEADDDDESSSPKPIKLGDTHDAQILVKLSIPGKYTVRAPIGIDVKRDYAEYHSSYKYEGGQLTSDRSLKTNSREVPYARVEDYAAFRRAVIADQAQQISLENKSPGSAGVAVNESADDLNDSAMQALRNNHYDLAADLFQRTLKLNPNHKTAWENLGLAYLSLNQTDRAIEAFQKQIALNPYDQYAYAYLGLAYQRQQKYDEAIRQFQKQIEINPLDQRAHADLGSLYASQKKFAEALPELQKASDIDPKNPLLQVSLGQAYVATGETEKGMAAFERAISLAPSPVIWNNIAYALSEQNVQLDRADKYIDTAISAVETQLRDINLDNLRAQDLGTAHLLFGMWDTKGWIAFQRGDLDAAESWIGPAWQASGRGDEAEHLGEIYEKRGKHDEAIRYYVESLAVDNPSDQARARLTALKATKGLDSKIADSKRELQRQRMHKLEQQENGAADFFVLMGPSRIEQVKFIKGSDGLKTFSESLQKVPLKMEFPKGAEAHVPRRVQIVCGSEHSKASENGKSGPGASNTDATRGPCVLELLPADAVRGID
jgi:tetratricopeptide (TPR) repeat protein